MGVKLFWKSVLRRRASLALLLALLIAAVFGFVLRAVEYLAVSQEIERISGDYRMIGTISAPDFDISDWLSQIEENPYVDFVNTGRYCSAILTDVYNADVDGQFSHNASIGFDLGTSDVLVWAEVEKKKETLKPGEYQYDLRVREAVYGYPEYTGYNRLIRVTWGQRAAAEMEPGNTYLIKAYYDSSKSGSFGDGLYFQLQELEEGVWFIEGEPDEETAGRYIDEDALLQERNRHAMTALTSVDMSALPSTQEDSRTYYLEDGRWLNLQDQEEGRKVCVIHKDFASRRGFQVGDTLQMTIQDALLPWWGYVTSQDEDPWESSEKITGAFEVVGIYGDIDYSDGYNWRSAPSNCLYIPDSCVPEHYAIDEKEEIWSFSFVLARPEFRDLFLQELEEPFASQGITVSFFENNWDSFHVSAEGIRWEAFYSFLIFTAVLAVALAAVIFLYTWQRKKEIAIARALGVSAWKAALGALWPMLFWGMTGILVGESIAWKYGLKQAEETLAALNDKGSISLSMRWFVGGGLLIWLILALAALIGTCVCAHKPVLGSLQAGPAKQRKTGTGKRTAETGSERSAEEKLRKDTVLRKDAEKPLKAAPQKSGSFLAGARFVRRHLYRFSSRSFFALLAAAVFVTASCWLHHSILAGQQKVERLYQTTEVEAEISRREAWSSAKTSGWTVKKLMDTGYIQDCYLVAEESCQIGLEGQKGTRQNVQLQGTTDREQFLSDFGDSFRLQYAPGYGEALFEEDYEQVECCTVIVPESLWEKWKLSGGEQIEILKVDEWLGVVKYSISVQVGGFYSGGDQTTVLAPMSLVRWMDGNYTVVRFTLDPKRNRELDTFRDISQEAMDRTGASELGLTLRILDSELRQTAEPLEKNITLMKILYPLANIISVLASCGLSILFLFQRRREAAILRVLGVNTTQTRMILVLELLLVSLAGILLGAGLTVLLAGRDGLSATPLAAGCYFLGCLAGTIAGAVWVANGRPLELLQEKE